MGFKEYLKESKNALNRQQIKQVQNIVKQFVPIYNNLKNIADQDEDGVWSEMAANELNDIFQDYGISAEFSLEDY